MPTRKYRNIQHSRTLKHKRIQQNPTVVYSKTDYESNDGMLTTIWGPGMWHYLHTMSFNYPTNPTPDDKVHYRDFILQLQYVLPCGKCRKNLKQNFKKMPLTHRDMESRETFSKYIYRLHEFVNYILHKKSGLSYEMVRERYEHFRARCAIPMEQGIIVRNRQDVREFAKEGLPSKILSLKKPLNIITEKGCTEPLYGEKSKCILKIVPVKTKCKTLEIDKKCIKQKIPHV